MTTGHAAFIVLLYCDWHHFNFDMLLVQNIGFLDVLCIEPVEMLCLDKLLRTERTNENILKVD